MTGLLPPEAIAPFAEEVRARAVRRQRRAAAAGRRLAAEVRAAEAAAAAALGPSVAELKVNS